MANSIGLFKKYIDLLSEVYVATSKTQMLDSPASTMEQGKNANELVIPKMTMTGLGDYDRNTGYTTGDVTIEYQTVPFNYDRGTAFEVDAMDNLETGNLMFDGNPDDAAEVAEIKRAGKSFGMLSSRFMSTEVVPEQDAFRFASYAGTTGISAATPVALTTGIEVRDALVVAISQMDDDEVPETDRHLFITPTLYNVFSAMDTDKSREIIASFASITKVPQKRFYTGIDLGTDGYAKSAGATNINFMIIHKPAVIQYPKHMVSKVINPTMNQSKDAWKFPFRSYGLTDVYDTMVAGIYLHASTV